MQEEKVYREVPPDYKFERVFLPEDVFNQARPAFIQECTDIIPINRQRRTLYLAPRISQPMAGWWWIGGRRYPGETKREAAKRNFNRETSLHFGEKQFENVSHHELLCLGIHYSIWTFAAEVSPDHVAYISDHLDQKEYDRTKGLREFTREQLIKERIHPSILTFYDKIENAVGWGIKYFPGGI
ncbi:MAG: hypothetical protein HY472_00740 [Candidatus Sungbacteria bacterium]|nr:hypothetical protein [Candidatus Sungbacteria bacterium]